MNNKVKEALGSASYLTYHWRQYSFEQLEKEMVRVCATKHWAFHKMIALQTSSEVSGQLSKM